MRASFLLLAVATVVAPLFLLLESGDDREASTPPTAEGSARAHREPVLEPARSPRVAPHEARTETAWPSSAKAPADVAERSLGDGFEALFADASESDRKAARAILDAVLDER